MADSASLPPASKLIGLSGMGAEQTSLFLNAWFEMEGAQRERLVAELAGLAEDNVELNFDAVFLAGLADAEAAVRRRAIAGLWEYEGRDFIDHLFGLLTSDPDASVRAEAALALGRFVMKAEFDALCEADAERVERALRRTIDDVDEVMEVRGRALEAVGARSEDWVRDLIEEAFEGADRRMRISAVHAMGRNCDASWLPALTSELRSDDPEMRFEAAAACGSIAGEAAAEHLLPLLADEDAEVQEAAISALGQIGGAQTKNALQELAGAGDERTRDAALAALAEVEFLEKPLDVDLPR